jgi:hypothetical protein
MVQQQPANAEANGAASVLTVGVGQVKIPAYLLDSSLAVRIGTLVDQQSSESPVGGVICFWPAIVLRNVIFIGVMLVNGFRRLAPPY